MISWMERLEELSYFQFRLCFFKIVTRNPSLAVFPNLWRFSTLENYYLKVSSDLKQFYTFGQMFY